MFIYENNKALKSPTVNQSFIFFLLTSLASIFLNIIQKFDHKLISSKLEKVFTE